MHFKMRLKWLEMKSHGFSNPKGQKLTSNIFISWCTGTVSTVLTRNRIAHFTYKTWRYINRKRVCDAIYTATLSFGPELFSHRNLESNFECLHRCPCRPNFGKHLPTLKDAADVWRWQNASASEVCKVKWGGRLEKILCVRKETRLTELSCFTLIRHNLRAWNSQCATCCLVLSSSMNFTLPWYLLSYVHWYKNTGTGNLWQFDYE